MIPGHGIYSEIPASEVLSEAGHKGHALWPSAVDIASVCPVRGYLKRLRFHHQRHGPMFYSCIYYIEIRKYSLYILRPGARCHIPVMWILTHEEVSYASPDYISLISRFMQLVYYISRAFRQLHNSSIPSVLAFRWLSST